MSKFLQRGPIVYPFLFAIYPILFLWSNNIQELSLYTSNADLLLPMAISVFVTLFLLVFAWLFFRNWKKAALLVAFFLFLFFSYGHVQEIVADSARFGYTKHRVLFSIWVGIFIVGGLLILRIRSDLRYFTNLLNIIAIVLVLFTLPDIVSYEPFPASPLAERDVTSANDKVFSQNEVEGRPDIYYITAEGYSSERTLKKYLNYDNSPFINYLERNGFYVAKDSNSNHSRTILSLATSLSMEYLTQFTSDDFDGWDGYTSILLDNKVVRLLKQEGYRIVYLRERDTPKGDLDGRDLYYGCEKVGRVSLHAEEFAGALLHTTALEPFLRRFSFLEAEKIFLRSCDFSQLIKSKDLEGPKLVMVHLLGPGKAFLIGDDGPKAFLEQVSFTNEGLMQVVDALLSQPDYRPVIIIQGDHGEGYAGNEASEQDVYRARMGILNAYHFPEGGDSLLYPSISPVNSFRAVFNYYFETNFEFLDDRSFYTGENYGPFDFLDITDLVRQEIGE